jgi:hypothetical protein
MEEDYSPYTLALGSPNGSEARADPGQNRITRHPLMGAYSLLKYLGNLPLEYQDHRCNTYLKRQEKFV